MTTQDLQAVDAAPAPDATAALAPEVDSKPVEPTEQQPAKVFTQEELDAAIGKRLAREARKWERERTRPAAQPVAPVTPPNVADFADAPAYAEALAETKAVELVNKRLAEQAAVALRESYEDRAEVVRDKYADFEQVAYNPAVPVTQSMAEAVMAEELGPEILYFLGSNPLEAARISQLSSTRQGAEIGKLAAKLATAPPAKTTSSAPAPISPVSARTVAAKTLDTTDPRSIKSMSDSEWINAENERVRKRLEANRNR